MYKNIKYSSNKKNIIIIPKKTEQHNFKNDIKINSNNKSYENIRKIVENNSEEKNVEKISKSNEKNKLSIV
jgi:hypothetical protein